MLPPLRKMGLAVAAVLALSLLAACAFALAEPALAFGTTPGVGAPGRPAGGGDLSTGPGAGPGIAIPEGALAPGDEGPQDNPDAPKLTPPPIDPAALPKVHHDPAELPPPVAAMRDKIMEAARSGDPEALRPVIALSKPPPLFSALGDGDPIDVLKASSGDAEGREILAILLDVLDAGWVVKDEGTARARYVWPYFAEFPPEALSPRQLVETYRVMTAGDFEEMRAAGAYEFYRVEIAANGRWLLFMSGE